jgi:hypothetical protein
MCRLTTGIRSEKCVVRRFPRCANVTHYSHKPTQYSIPHYTPHTDHTQTHTKEKTTTQHNNKKQKPSLYSIPHYPPYTVITKTRTLDYTPLHTIQCTHTNPHSTVYPTTHHILYSHKPTQYSIPHYTPYSVLTQTHTVQYTPLHTIQCTYTNPHSTLYPTTHLHYTI